MVHERLSFMFASLILTNLKRPWSSKNLKIEEINDIFFKVRATPGRVVGKEIECRTRMKARTV